MSTRSTHPPVRCLQALYGFTLIELLVVVTIIVVLLALLVPALDKAIYQAELMVCGTRLHGIVTGAQVYAMDHKRSYPNRTGLQGQTRPDRVYIAGNNNRLPMDDRLIIRGYININGLLNDPLTKKIDLESPRSSPTIGPNVCGSYLLWYGWRYNKRVGGGKGMNRLGDRFVWQGDSFSVLATDKDGVEATQSLLTSSHPDNAGLMHNLVYQDGQYVGDGAGPNAAVAEATNVANAFTLSWWSAGTATGRGTLDMNYGSDDGSVVRYNNVETNDPSRMAKVPYYNDEREPSWEFQIPLPASP